MPDIGDFISQVRTKLTTLSPALSAPAASSDLRTDLDTVAAGSTHYRVRAQGEQAVRDSNQNIQGASMVLEISHKLANYQSERLYTEGEMLAHMAALMDKEWWRVDAVREITSSPDMHSDVAREGNVISWAVMVKVAIKP